MTQYEVCCIAHQDSQADDVSSILQIHRIPTRKLTLAEAEREDWDTHWHRIALIDIRGAVDQGFDLALQIKRVNAALPVIVVAQPHYQTFLTISKARVSGAESIWLPPYSAVSDLLEMLRQANKKLDHWRGVLERIAEPNHAPVRGLPGPAFSPILRGQQITL